MAVKPAQIGKAGKRVLNDKFFQKAKASRRLVQVDATRLLAMLYSLLVCTGRGLPCQVCLQIARTAAEA